MIIVGKLIYPVKPTVNTILYYIKESDVFDVLQDFYHRQNMEDIIKCCMNYNKLKNITHSEVDLYPLLCKMCKLRHKKN